MSVNSEIIKRLKTGSIKNVLLFGDSFDKQEVPYVVVRPIASGDRKLYQIIVHMNLGLQDPLEKYLLNELSELLKEPLQIESNIITIRSTGAWLGPNVDEFDDTLVMSRDFFVPMII